MLTATLSATMPSTSVTHLYDLYTMYDVNDVNSFETTRTNNNNNTQIMVTFSSDPLFWGGGWGGGR